MVCGVMSEIPILPGRLKQENIDREILRAAIIAELDAISLYEQLADSTDNTAIKKVLLDIAREEKTHVGELLTLLLTLDKEQEEELEKGKKEVEEILEE